MTRENNEPSGAQTGGQLALKVVSTVRDLALELHPLRRRTLDVRLDSDLDRDLGFDSLSRAELVLRLERQFGVDLPDRLISDATSPGDLVAALATAVPGEGQKIDRPPTQSLDFPALAEPTHARTLLQALDYYVERYPDLPHITLWERDAATVRLSYSELARRARRFAGGLVELGLEAGGRTAIMLPTCEGFFTAFIGTLMAGGVPVPIYPPFRRAQLEEHIRRQAKILINCEAFCLVTDEETHAAGELVYGLAPSLRRVETMTRLTKSDSPGRFVAAKPDDIALIQYTSGSTGDPKGVVLTHANLLANIRAMGEAMEASFADSVVSWLPLYHDMGLIGTWLGALYFGAPTCIMSPLNFIADPARWLRAIDQRKATITAAPNFAFELCLKRIRDEDIEGVDLSSLRRVINGAEPVSPSTVRRFIERFEKYGFSAKAMAPTYGLAENAVGLAFPPLGRAPLFDRVERRALSELGFAKPATGSDIDALEFTACGQPLPGHQVRIIDETGQEAAERNQGRLQFKGPSSTKGYFRNSQKNKALFDGDWLDSGDLAYIAGGDIYVTGRIKDMIIRAGRHIYPQELEEAIGNIDGVRKGCVAVFASKDERTGSERLVVLAETPIEQDQERQKLRLRISGTVADIVELPPDDVVLAGPRTVPKTSSGKIRRSAARELYESDAIDARGRALWRQLMRLTLTGSLNRASRAFRTFRSYVYAAYWWGALGVIGAITWVIVMTLPQRDWRYFALHKAGRLFFWCVGIEFEVDGALPELPPGVVITANHASYLDGLAVSAAIPGALSFMVAERFSRQFMAGNFLRRLGAMFVTGQLDKGSEEKATTIRLIRAGERVVIFPEGRVRRMPGLLSFFIGPFITAVEAAAPVIPLTILGTRSALRDGGHWFPRRGPVSVHIGTPIFPESHDFEAAVILRDRVRGEILSRCGEPELEREKVDFGAEES
jgi:1-acyl-sn-glycerol-3-phosphate acyltransferase